MITTFNNVESAFHFFKENENTGLEVSFNDEIYFGVGCLSYCWTELVTGIIPQKGNNKLFTWLTDDELMIALSILMKKDGVIWIDDFSDFKDNEVE